MTVNRDVYWLLKRAAGQLKTELRKKIEENGITWPQLHALYHIGEEGLPAHELARELHCNASNMTGLIDRMAENGWVYREQSQADRRVWLVKATQDGLRLKNSVLPRHQANIEARMAVLSPQELSQLRELLTKLMGLTGEEGRDEGN